MATVWERIMRGEFKLPAKLAGKSAALPVSNHRVAVDDNAVNDVDSTPYQVRVRPPSDYVPPISSGPSTAAENQSKTLILRLGRSLANQDEATLPLLSEEDAHWLTAQI